MHIRRVNKPITIVFNCLEMEGEAWGERKDYGALAWSPLIACVVPSLGSIDTGPINTWGWLIIAGTPLLLQVCASSWSIAERGGALSACPL